MCEKLSRFSESMFTRKLVLFVHFRSMINIHEHRTTKKASLYHLNMLVLQKYINWSYLFYYWFCLCLCVFLIMKTCLCTTFLMSHDIEIYSTNTQSQTFVTNHNNEYLKLVHNTAVQISGNQFIRCLLNNKLWNFCSVMKKNSFFSFS